MNLLLLGVLTLNVVFRETDDEGYVSRITFGCDVTGCSCLGGKGGGLWTGNEGSDGPTCVGNGSGGCGAALGDVSSSTPPPPPVKKLVNFWK